MVAPPNCSEKGRCVIPTDEVTSRNGTFCEGRTREGEAEGEGDCVGIVSTGRTSTDIGLGEGSSEDSTWA